MTNHTAEITRLEAERDEIDQRWRRLRQATVRTLEERRALDMELAGLEVQYREREAAIAVLHVAAVERRLSGIEDVDQDAMARAETEYLRAKAVYDELRARQHAAYVRRQDAERDLKAARQALSEAEYARERRREKLADVKARPARGLAPAAMWIGDGRR